MTIKYEALEHVINEEGYDDDGHYWSIGEPLFYISAICHGVLFDDLLRARDEATALEIAKQMWPASKFEQSA